MAHPFLVITDYEKGRVVLKFFDGEKVQHKHELTIYEMGEVLAKVAAALLYRVADQELGAMEERPTVN